MQNGIDPEEAAKLQYLEGLQSISKGFGDGYGKVRASC
jgi:hypothetical protein